MIDFAHVFIGRKIQQIISLLLFNQGGNGPGYLGHGLVTLTIVGRNPIGDEKAQVFAGKG